MFEENEEIEFISTTHRNKFIKEAREALKNDGSTKKNYSELKKLFE